MLGVTLPGLYDIGVPAVADAFNHILAPPEQYHITPDHWNDTGWVEQPISRYMVSVSEGEDFAEAVRTFIEAPELLRQRSPHRFNFLQRNRAAWQSRMLRPHAPQRSFGVSTGMYLVVPDPNNNPLNYERLSGFGNRKGEIVEVVHDDEGYFYMWQGRRIPLPERP
jgi:hypothetical protein